MNLEEKVRLGIKYMIDQSEKKLNGLGAIENGVFKPTDPKAFKKHKEQVEFRLKFCLAVEELLTDHVELIAVCKDILKTIEEKSEVKEDSIDSLKKIIK